VLRIEWICSQRKPSLQIPPYFTGLVVLCNSEVPCDFRSPATGQSLRALDLNILQARVKARRAKSVEQFNLKLAERALRHVVTDKKLGAVRSAGKLRASNADFKVPSQNVGSVWQFRKQSPGDGAAPG
jgi:hypothetical protein